MKDEELKSLQTSHYLLFIMNLVLRFVYYDTTTERELNRRPIYECPYDERLKPKAEGSTRLTYTGFRERMILLHQNKKRRESGKKCHTRTVIHSKEIKHST
jgi:hypothetical protein